MALKCFKIMASNVWSNFKPILEEKSFQYHLLSCVAVTCCVYTVVISNTGKVMGKSRKNHIPRVGDFNEVGGDV